MNQRILLVAIAAVVVLGCEKRPRGGLWRAGAKQAKAAELEIDGSKVRADLYNWADETTAEIAGLAADIARAAPDTRTREMALRWKLRSVVTIQSLVLDPDPRRALIITWMSMVQMRQYFTEGRGKNIFGEQTARAATLTHELEERLEDIIRRNVPEDAFTAADADIEKLAREEPIAMRGGAGRLQVGDISRASEESGVEKILALPLAPLTGLQGVSSTAEAVSRLGVILTIITEIVENLPEQTRWQIEALLLELESSRSMEELRDAVKRTNEHIMALTNETQRAIDIVEQLPGEVDRQRKRTLEKISGERAAALEDIEGHMEVIVDHIFWRLIQLVCVILIGVGLLVLLIRKRPKREIKEMKK